MRNERLKILLVEDDDSHAMITTRSLRDLSVACDVTRVRDGAEAMDYLHHEGSFGDASRPDLILLDLNVPKLSGHEVLQRVKSDADLRPIPVVILSTSDAEVDRLQAYRHHANSYLVKPSDLDSVRQMGDELSRYWGVWNRSAVA